MTLSALGRVLGVVAAGSLLLVGRPSAGRAALTYDVSLGAGGVTNDNFYLDPEPGADGQRGPVSETMFTVAPALELEWVVEHDQLSAEYRGEYWQFAGDEELDPRWRHDLEANLGWRRWAPFFLDVTESLSMNPSAQGRNVEAAIDYTYTNMLSARTGLSWAMGARGTVELSYRVESETYPDVEDADKVLRQYGEGLLHYRWNPLWGSELRVAYGHVLRELTPDYDELSASVAVDQRVSEHLLLRYSLEWLSDATDAAPGTDPAAGDGGGATSSSLLKGLEISGDFSAASTWSLGYEDNLDYLQDGDTLKTGRASADVALSARLGSTLSVEGWHETRDYRVSGREETAWGVNLNARWLIVPWAACDVRGTWTDTAIKDVGAPEVGDQTSGAAIGVLFLLYRRLQLEAGYDYRRNDSTDASRSYTGSRIYAFVSYHFRPLEPGTLPSTYFSRADNPPGVSAQGR